MHIEAYKENIDHDSSVDKTEPGSIDTMAPNSVQSSKIAGIALFNVEYHVRAQNMVLRRRIVSRLARGQ